MKSHVLRLCIQCEPGVLSPLQCRSPHYTRPPRQPHFPRLFFAFFPPAKRDFSGVFPLKKTRRNDFFPGSALIQAGHIPPLNPSFWDCSFRFIPYHSASFHFFLLFCLN
ncbi:MAG: hypothetical protein MPJ83_01845, partial [Gammaproteobacteria bacterium]|nr:hypothetical protein [Gammaproteobacteria bacterium]